MNFLLKNSLLIGIVFFPLMLEAQTLDSDLDTKFNEFWSANSEKVAEKTAKYILKLTQDSVLIRTRLSAGASYAANLPLGKQVFTRKNQDGQKHAYIVYIPESYDPSKAYPVHFYLHGGVSRETVDPEQNRWRGDTQPLIDENNIAVFPHGWVDSLWWQKSQTENLHGILRDLSSRYHLDSNRVFLYGVSDGGTGIWYQAAANPTPFAGFFALNSNPGVLSNLDSGVDHDFYPFNLLNRPFFVVNGGQDPLYPLSLVKPLFDFFTQLHIRLTLVAREEAKHNTQWWPEVAPAMVQFELQNPRNPFPDRLYWRMGSRLDEYNRIHWLRIDKLKKLPEDSKIEAYNPIYVEETGERLFPRTEKSGRVVAEFSKNKFQLITEGVSRVTLLLSSSMVDFSKPVQVVANGSTLFDGEVTLDPEVLLHWAAVDRDPQMLFDAELTMEIPD